MNSQKEDKFSFGNIIFLIILGLFLTAPFSLSLYSFFDQNKPFNEAFFVYSGVGEFMGFIAWLLIISIIVIWALYVPKISKPILRKLAPYFLWLCFSILFLVSFNVYQEKLTLFYIHNKLVPNDHAYILCGKRKTNQGIKQYSFSAKYIFARSDIGCLPLEKSGVKDMYLHEGFAQGIQQLNEKYGDK